MRQTTYIALLCSLSAGLVGYQLSGLVNTMTDNLKLRAYTDQPVTLGEGFPEQCQVKTTVGSLVYMLTKDQTLGLPFVSYPLTCKELVDNIDATEDRIRELNAPKVQCPLGSKCG